MADAAIAGLGLEFHKNRQAQALEREKLEETTRRFDQTLRSTDEKFEKGLLEKQRQWDQQEGRLLEASERDKFKWEKDQADQKQFKSILNGWNSEDGLKVLFKLFQATNNPAMFRLFNELQKLWAESAGQIIDHNFLSNQSRASQFSQVSGASLKGKGGNIPDEVDLFKEEVAYNQLLHIKPKSRTVTLKTNNINGVTTYGASAKELSTNLSILLGQMGVMKIPETSEAWDHLMAIAEQYEKQYEENPDLLINTTLTFKEKLNSETGEHIAYVPFLKVEVYEYDWNSESTGKVPGDIKQRIKQDEQDRISHAHNVVAALQNKRDSEQKIREVYYKKRDNIEKLITEYRSLELKRIQLKEFEIRKKRQAQMHGKELEDEQKRLNNFQNDDLKLTPLHVRKIADFLGASPMTLLRKQFKDDLWSLEGLKEYTRLLKIHFKNAVADLKVFHDAMLKQKDKPPSMEILTKSFDDDPEGSKGSTRSQKIQELIAAGKIDFKTYQNKSLKMLEDQFNK